MTNDREAFRIKTIDKSQEDSKDDDKIIIERTSGWACPPPRPLKEHERINAWEMMGLDVEEVTARAIKSIEKDEEKSKKNRVKVSCSEIPTN